MPLPTYDANGVLLPHEYEEVLVGAVVRVKISFVSYCIGKKMVVMVSELQEVRILKAAPKIVNSGQKCKLACMHDAVMKKPRTCA